ncbi:peptidase domain-containing ABC transporter [Bacillus coahuilensis]|uniref:peptidase domain-containing ABC transporter n=1 Tax=Bacillus coahuilensis TaxID=408580 RepID=UPI0001850FDA|nr:peptidase domain-containing ABC transporter [Bacillus coahuilensis]
MSSIHKVDKKNILIADPASGLKKMSHEEFKEIWTGILILMVPNEEFKKGNHVKGNLSRFIQLLIPHQPIVWMIFLASILFVFFGIIGAFYFKWLIDDILVNDLTSTLHTVSIGIIVLYLFKVILQYLRMHLLLYLSRRIDIVLMLGYYKHIMGMPMRFFDTRKVGEIISRFMDASKIRDAISSATLTVMIDVLMVAVGSWILYAQSPTLFGVTLCLIPFYTLIILVFHKPYESVNEKIMEENASLTSYMVESISGIQTFKSNNAETQAINETEKRFIKLLHHTFKNGNINNIQESIRTFLELIGGVIVLWVGATLVLKGDLTIGQLITFHALLAYFINPIQNIIQLHPTIQSAVVASKRLVEILDLELETNEKETHKINPKSLLEDIVLENVSFRYGTRRNVLQNVTLKISKGQRVAFVGESGSGKTTLTKLLMKFYQPNEGDIKIGDFSLSDIHKEALRDHISYVSQESFFFSGTIRENLMLGAPEDTTMEDLIEACNKAQVKSFIEQLPLRYETILEENGSNLSGGQKQRLSIARALLRNPDILLLDEATSHLDSITEHLVSESFENIDRTITMIVIAHRLSTVMNCDLIFVFDKGNVIEMGTHNELLEYEGKYYELWIKQHPVQKVISETGALV